MDLLEAVLRTCNSEQHLEEFRDHNIKYDDLKLLSDEDLERLNVTDAVRELMLKNCRNLQDVNQVKSDFSITSGDLRLVLNEVTVQLTKHFTNILYASKQENPNLYGLKLGGMSDTLEQCLLSLHRDIDVVESLVSKNSPSFTIIWPLTGAIVIGTAFTVYTFLFHN